MKRFFLPAVLFLSFSVFSADVIITINGDSGRMPISPWIYGRNNSLSDDPDKPVSADEWRRYRDAGLRLLRENGGNNCTKYNWRKKLSSHPDWYNNVYRHDWDYLARTLQDSLPSAQGFMGLQLLGKVAATTNRNFNDWEYNKSAWWDGCAQNLAGGGEVNPDGGGEALTGGNPDEYLEPWPADSSTGILDHWFGPGGQGLDHSRFLYWNMDNEPEIWSGTHDDAFPQNITAEEFMQRYFAVAKSARLRFPQIRLAGFVACNEWQWYAWDNGQVTVNENGAQRKYVWAEYFIKRIAEEQKASGVRLLDVMDFHFYPGTTSDPDLTMQLHRVWFDTGWVYPKANGCKLIGGGWDENSRKEYIMERCGQWLDQYMGSGHGVGMGVSECGNFAASDPNVVAVWYASQLGTFADHGVELFTPWEWHPGMWEVLHLFTSRCGPVRVRAHSSLDTVVSAYASIRNDGSSMTVILVNRDRTSAKNAVLQLDGFSPSAAVCSTFTIRNLPSGSETFVSAVKNALIAGSAPVTEKSLSLDLPALSVTAAVINGHTAIIRTGTGSGSAFRGQSIDYRRGSLVVRLKQATAPQDVALYDLSGVRIRYWRRISGDQPVVLSLAGLPAGRYVADAGCGTVRQLVVHIP